MGNKVIIRSATIDRHGDFTSVDMLYDYAAAVNGPEKLRYLANHRRDIPPIGYFDEAEVRDENGVHHVWVLPIEFEKHDAVDWDSDLVMTGMTEPVSLLRENFEKLQQIRFTVDKNNFGNVDDLKYTGNKIGSSFNGQVSLQLDIRKQLLPDPRIIITLAPYAMILYPLVKPFLKKMGEKFAEDVADDIYKSCKSGFKGLIKRLSSSVQVAREKMVPVNKVLLTIFEIPGDPYVELHIRSDDPMRVEKGLQPRKLAVIHEKITHFQQYVDVSEIYFVLSPKNKWEFSYLLTRDGKAIGTKSAFKKRDHLITRINLSPEKAFSIGASGVVYEQRRTAKSPS